MLDLPLTESQHSGQMGRKYSHTLSDVTDVTEAEAMMFFTRNNDLAGTFITDKLHVLLDAAHHLADSQLDSAAFFDYTIQSARCRPMRLLSVVYLSWNRGNCTLCEPYF